MKATALMDRLSKNIDHAETTEKELKDLVGLSMSPGFQRFLAWVYEGIETRREVCCSLKASEQETQVARAEIRLMRGIIGLFDQAESALPMAMKTAEYLRAKGKGWQDMQIGAPIGVQRST